MSRVISLGFMDPSTKYRLSLTGSGRDVLDTEDFGHILSLGSLPARRAGSPVNGLDGGNRTGAGQMGQIDRQGLGH